MAILLVVLLMLTVLTYQLRSMEKRFEEESESQTVVTDEKSLTGILGSQAFIYTAIVLSIVGMVACLYLLVRGTVWEGHLMEWLNIIVRLMHITFGIAWIGASFLFRFSGKCA